MKTYIKKLEKATDIIENILKQGDSRYNDSEAEKIFSLFFANDTILLEEKNLPLIKKPEKEETIKHSVQGEEKYIAQYLLRLKGFEDNEIFFERTFRSSKPDVLGEKGDLIIPVECCSCRISKIIDFLSEVNEVWIITYGEPPWEKKPLYQKTKWFIIKRGPNWDETFALFTKNQEKELKKIHSPLDDLM